MPVKQNDDLPYLTVVVKDKNGVLDLTNVNTVRVIVEQDDVAIVDVTGGVNVVVTPLSGKVEYKWQGENSTPGDIEVVLELTWSSGEKQRVPTEGYFLDVIHPRKVID